MLRSRRIFFSKNAMQTIAYAKLVKKKEKKIPMQMLKGPQTSRDQKKASTANI